MHPERKGIVVASSVRVSVWPQYYSTVDSAVGRWIVRNELLRHLPYSFRINRAHLPSNAVCLRVTSHTILGCFPSTGKPVHKVPCHHHGSVGIRGERHVVPLDRTMVDLNVNDDVFPYILKHHHVFNYSIVCIIILLEASNKGTNTSWEVRGSASLQREQGEWCQRQPSRHLAASTDIRVVGAGRQTLRYYYSSRKEPAGREEAALAQHPSNEVVSTIAFHKS